jgi:microsomal dipeptidase-like Zn-dependent dipeptidase
VRSLRSRSIAIWALLPALFFFFVAPPLLDAVVNRRTGAALPAVTPEARALHDQLWVADLHADSLMWNRSIAERHARGLVDLPRLIEGGVALQAFTVVSQAPWGMNVHENSGDSDMLGLLLVAQRWPVRTWSSLLERALYQADRLHRVARESGGTFQVIVNRRQLERYRRERVERPRVSAGLLGIEGAQVLDGDFDNLARLFDAGFRMLGPAHFFDTEVGGSAHGEDKGGLTPLGRRVVRRMQEIGMLVDLAHASSRTIDDVLALETRPVLFSHTGVTATCPGPRNVSDDQIRRTAALGGVIGIAFFEEATCGTDLSAVVRAMRHVADLVGAEHVALGSDFDGFVTTPIDASQMPVLTQALLSAGFEPAQVRLIMGENVARVLGRTLPE